MTISPMYKVCGQCDRKFTYNISVGDMGFICPYCKSPANISVKGSLLSEVRKLLNKVRKP